MRKLFLLFILISLCSKNKAQTKPVNGTTTIGDSVNEENTSSADSYKVTSYFIVGMALGNRLLSVRNKVANAKETSANMLIYTPTITYQNKSGFNIAAGSSLLNDSVKGFSINQSFVTTGYQLLGNDNIDFSMAYTHYFIADKYSTSSSPIQNDFFSSFSYKKSWLQPGIAFDFSSGNSYEINKKNRFYDSITNKLKSYAFIASVGHGFSWESVFTEDDGLSFTPSFLLNAGASKINISHKTNAAITQLIGKKGKLTKFQNSKFAAESVGLDLYMSYNIGKFTLEPDLYLDYYLPTTTANRVTGIFNINFSYKF